MERKRLHFGDYRKREKKTVLEDNNYQNAEDETCIDVGNEEDELYGDSNLQDNDIGEEEGIEETVYCSDEEDGEACIEEEETEGVETVNIGGRIIKIKLNKTKRNIEEKVKLTILVDRNILKVLRMLKENEGISYSGFVTEAIIALFEAKEV